MAEEEKKTTTVTATPRKPKAAKSPLIGAQAKPTVLDKTTKLDIDTEKELPDLIIEAGLNNVLNTSAIENFTSVSNARDQIYQLIDTMAADSSVSAIIKAYTDNVCEVSDNGHIVWCESDDPVVSKFINYLLNVMNVDKNIFTWTYSLIKYGDLYLRLYRESDYEDPYFKKSTVDTVASKNILNEAFDGDLYDVDKNKELDESVNLNIHNASDHYSYYVEMITDPGSMFELTKYGKTYGYIEIPVTDNKIDSWFQNYLGQQNQPVANYRMRSDKINIYQADDFVHASLDDNMDRFPERVELFNTDDDLQKNTNSTSYLVRRGKSLLYDNYKVWREKSLLEDAILLNRLTRSSVVRIVQTEVGDMGKTQSQQTVNKVKSLFEQKSALNVGNGMSEYNSPGPVENNIYITTHEGKGAITVSAIGGDIDVKNLADLDSWVNKYYAGFSVPKAYFGWTDDGAGFNGGTSLSIISSEFAKGAKRIQNSVIQALTDAINLFLINRGLKTYLNNFVLKMKTPSTQEEKDYREAYSNQLNAISSYMALFTDVEDKADRLAILKDQVKSLNRGDEVIQILDKEIEMAIAAKKKEEEEAKKAAEAEAALEANEAGGGASMPTPEPPVAEEAPEEAPASEDTDLGMASVATEESFTKSEDGTILVEGPDYNLEINDNLPTPEELDEKKDFTKNN